MKKITILLLAFMISLTGCTFTESAGTGSSMTGAKAHLNTTGVGLRFLFIQDLIGTPTIDGALNGLEAEAQKHSAKNVRIVQSSSSNLWWIFPPFSIFINPIITNIAADIK